MANVAVAVTRTSGVDPVAELAALDSDIDEVLPGRVAVAAAGEAHSAILDSVVDVRGTLSVSGLGATLGLGVSLGATPGEVELAAEPLNAWALVNNGAVAHTQRVWRGGLGPQAMTTSYGLFSRVNHPGTVGLNVWEPACDAADDAADPAANAAADEVMPGG